MNEALATVEDNLLQRVAEGRFTPTESAMLHRLVKLRPGQKPPTRDELALVISEAMHLGLDPFAGQCYFINFGDSWQTYPHVSGLLKIAEDSGEYRGHDGPFYSDDGKTWTDAWVPDTPPRFARAVIYRQGHHPKVAVAKWIRANRGTPNWKNDPEGMLGKAALRLGLRLAFPKQTASLSLVPEAVVVEDDQALVFTPMDDGQRRAIFAQLNDLDITDRDRRLLWASNVLGREVRTFKDLSQSDATVLLDWLGSTVENAAQAGGVGESTVSGSGQQSPTDGDHGPGAGGHGSPFPEHRQPLSAVGEDWQRADPAGHPGTPTAEGSLADGVTVLTDGEGDRETELIFRIAAAHSEWAKTMPRGAEAWFNGFLTHVKRHSLQECNLEELEAGWDWLVALNRAK